MMACLYNRPGLFTGLPINHHGAFNRLIPKLSMLKTIDDRELNRRERKFRSECRSPGMPIKNLKGINTVLKLFLFNVPLTEHFARSASHIYILSDNMMSRKFSQAFPSEFGGGGGGLTKSSAKCACYFSDQFLNYLIPFGQYTYDSSGGSKGTPPARVR